MKTQRKMELLNELMSVKARLKMVSYLLKKGYGVDEDEVDELLERRDYLMRKLKMEEEG